MLGLNLDRLFGILVFSLICTSTFGASYFVNPGDVLKIDVWNEDSLSSKVLVRPDGRISLPMAGEIDTSKSTPMEVGDKIARALGAYMKDIPQVVVSLVEVSGNKIYVIGKVAEPGMYTISSDTDVMQALALAGGLNAFAAENEIRILRRKEDGTQFAIPFEYAKVKSGKDLENNILLHSRDIVVVP
ncbi:MAG: polysaccharide biosynthesis/export family protein [Halioglobus sp.]|nr:polysaccharide biosynthesis/export family protein [Halioglobus sp.]